MRQGGRIQAAIEILADIETRHRPVPAALKDWGVSHRFAGSGDRAAIGNIVYDALRWRLSSAWVMDEDTPRAVVIGMIARRWGIGPAELAALFASDPHAPAALTVEEAARIDGRDLAAAPGHVRADLPEWLAARFAATFGERWIAEGEALALRPPLDMRANRLKADYAKVLKALEKFGAIETPFAPDGMRIPATRGDGRHPNVQVEPAFQKGWFEVQDEGSQLAALATAAKPGEQILDLCAGAGGKTLALAAMMANKGQVFATDSDRTRLAPIFDRLRRAGSRNVQVREAGASLADLAGRMDVVLVDAPCTGTGVWRRRPDAKWRLTEKALADRVAEQAALLETAAHFVKPGGRLVYVTCSLLPDENADQVGAFAASRGRFAATPGEAILESLQMPETAPRLAAASIPLPLGIMFTPASTGTDGFFVAVLKRSGNDAPGEGGRRAG